MAGMKSRWKIALVWSVTLISSLLAAESLGDFEKYNDVGINPVSGKTTFDAAKIAYRVTGGGADMWMKQDSFQFAYKRMDGDITLSADVAFEGKGGDPHRKAALMIRQSLETDAAYADIAVHGDGMTALQYRTSSGVDAAEFRLAMRKPKRMSIERRGNEISVWADDGIDKAANGPVIVSMSGPVYVGLAVCSHNADVLETALFSKLKWK